MLLMWIDQHMEESTWTANNLKELTRSIVREEVVRSGTLVLEIRPRIGFGTIDLHAVICRPGK